MIIMFEQLRGDLHIDWIRERAINLSPVERQLFTAKL